MTEWPRRRARESHRSPVFFSEREEMSLARRAYWPSRSSKPSGKPHPIVLDAERDRFAPRRRKRIRIFPSPDSAERAVFPGRCRRVRSTPASPMSNAEPRRQHRALRPPSSEASASFLARSSWTAPRRSLGYRPRRPRSRPSSTVYSLSCARLIARIRSRIASSTEITAGFSRPVGLEGGHASRRSGGYS